MTDATNGRGELPNHYDSVDHFYDRLSRKYPKYKNVEFPKVMYSPNWPTVPTMTVNSPEEESLLIDEGWACSPADHGKETHPGLATIQSGQTGIDFDELRAKRAAKVNERNNMAEAELAAKNEEEEDLEEQGESTEEEEEKPTPRRKKK